MKTALHRQFPNLLALALCLAMTAGCTKAAKARRLLSAAGRDFEAKRYDAAELEYESVLRLSRLNPVAIRQLGLLYYEDGRPEAFVYLKKALEQDPKNSQVQLRLAELYGASGGFSNALELLEPLGAASPIAKFLEKNPDGGMHHLCFEVDDIVVARDALKASGACVLGDGEPKIGAHGKPVLFLHPKDFTGTLIELEQA